MVSVTEHLFAYTISHRIYRVEKTTGATGNTKRDGVLFVVQNKTITPMFVELSGGIDFNSTEKKETDDEEKLIEQFINLLKIQKAEGVETPCQYYVRYFSKYFILSFAFQDLLANN